MKLLDRLRGIKAKAADSAGEHADQIKSGIDKAGEFVDERTGGKHADKIEQGKEKAKDATDSFTEQKQEPEQDTKHRRDET